MQCGVGPDHHYPLHVTGRCEPLQASATSVGVVSSRCIDAEVRQRQPSLPRADGSPQERLSRGSANFGSALIHASHEADGSTRDMPSTQNGTPSPFLHARFRQARNEAVTIYPLGLDLSVRRQCSQCAPCTWCSRLTPASHHATAGQRMCTHSQ